MWIVFFRCVRTVEEDFMSLKRNLEIFFVKVERLISSVGTKTTKPSLDAFSLSDIGEVEELWSVIRKEIKEDIEAMEFVDRKLKEIHAAFEDGDGDTVGRAAFVICVVADVKNLR